MKLLLIGLIIAWLSLGGRSVKVYTFEPPDPLGSLVQSRKRVLELEIRRKSEFLKRNWGVDLLSDSLPPSPISADQVTGKPLVEPPKKFMVETSKKPNVLPENRSLSVGDFRFIEKPRSLDNLTGMINSMKRDLETQIFSVISSNFSRVESSVENLIRTLNSSIRSGEEQRKSEVSNNTSSNEELREILKRLGNQEKLQGVNNSEIESFLDAKIRSEFSRYFELIPKNPVPIVIPKTPVPIDEKPARKTGLREDYEERIRFLQRPRPIEQKQEAKSPMDPQETQPKPRILLNKTEFRGKVVRIENLGCGDTIQAFPWVYKDSSLESLFRCLEDCRTSLEGEVYGSGVYRDDSVICKAALHSGIPTEKLFIVSISTGEIRYRSAVKNGVSTLESGYWPRSFYVEAVSENDLETCFGLEDAFLGSFEAKWQVLYSREGSFWDYEPDSMGEPSLEFRDNGLGLSGKEDSAEELGEIDRRSLSSMIMNREFSCRLGVLGLDFRIEGISIIMFEGASGLGRGRFGVLFRLFDEDDFMVLEVSERRNLRRVSRVRKDRKTTLFQVIDGNSPPLNHLGYNHLEFWFLEDKIEVFLNKNLLFSLADEEIASKGRSFGFVTSDLERVFIKSLKTSPEIPSSIDSPPGIVALDKKPTNFAKEYHNPVSESSKSEDSLEKSIRTLAETTEFCLLDSVSSARCSSLLRNHGLCYVQACRRCCAVKLQGNSLCESRCESLGSILN